MKRLILPLLLLAGLLWSPALQAQVSPDAASTASCGTVAGVDTTPCNITTDITWNHTTTSSANAVIDVFVLIDCSPGDTAPTVSTVTYNSVSLSQTKHVSSNARNGYDIWTLAAPASGTHAVLVTLTGSIVTACAIKNILHGAAFTASGVDQAIPHTSTSSGTGTGTTASCTVSSSGANDLGVFAASAGSHFTALAGSSPTQLWKFDNDELDDASSIGGRYAGGITAMSATVSASDSWLSVCGALKASGGGAATPHNFLSLGSGQ